MSEVLDCTAIAEGGMDALRGKLYAYAGEVEGWEKATPILAAYLEAEFRKHIAELEALNKRLRVALILVRRARWAGKGGFYSPEALEADEVIEDALALTPEQALAEKEEP